MKRFLSSLILFLLLLAVPSAFAHPGRTDANGGHTDRSTGEYHYHHGYPAHQHYDMDGDGIPDCPYDFKDKTGSSSSSSKSSTTSSNAIAATTKPTTPPATTATTSPTTRATTPPTTMAATQPTAAATTLPTTIATKPTIATAITPPTTKAATSPTSSGLTTLAYPSSSRSLSDDRSVPGILFLVGFLLIFHVYIHFSRKRTLQEYFSRLDQAEQAYQYQRKCCDKLIASEKENKAALAETQQKLLTAQSSLEKMRGLYSHYSEQTNKALVNRVNELTAARDINHGHLNELFNALRQTYGDDFLLSVSGAPPGVYLDSDGLPRLNPSDRTDPYMLHRSPTGKFHSPSCTHFPSCAHIHALNVSPRDFLPQRCQVCKPQYPNLEWLDTYLRLLDITKDLMRN